MSTELLLGIIVLLVVGNGIFFWFMMKRVKPGAGESEQKNDTGFNLLLQQMNELTRTVDSKMGETSKNMFDSMKYQAGETFKIHRDLTEKLVRLEEQNKQVMSFTDQLQSLQDILKNPKQRGILGEYYLETLLKNVLPPGSYQMQYAFADGDIVDCAVFVKDKVIPVDSKFSLENYNRIIEEKNPTERDRLEKLFINDLKLRIQEAAKYIRPNENTMDFAFMFIPHEAIYYDLLINKIGGLKDDTENLIQRAAGKYKVIIVSPTSFLAYLQTVLQGLKAMQIEETAKDIVKRVDELGKHLKSYEEYHGKMGNALGTVVSHFNSSSKEFKKLDKDVLRITGQAVGVEATLLEKPDVDS